MLFEMRRNDLTASTRKGRRARLPRRPTVEFLEGRALLAHFELTGMGAAHAQAAGLNQSVTDVDAPLGVYAVVSSELNPTRTTRHSFSTNGGVSGPPLGIGDLHEISLSSRLFVAPSEDNRPDLALPVSGTTSGELEVTIRVAPDDASELGQLASFNLVWSTVDPDYHVPFNRTNFPGFEVTTGLSIASSGHQDQVLQGRYTADSG